MKRLIVPVVLLLLLFAACKKTSPGPVPSPSPSPSPTLQSPSPSLSPSPVVSPSPSLSPSVPPTPQIYRNALTGIEVTDPETLKKRPAAVIYNNATKALPMFGISQADIIYEILAEGGITRMMAVFSDVRSIKSLGAIRSTRTYFLELALAHDAIMVHAGASYIAYDDMTRWGITTVDGTRGQSSYFWRDQGRVAAGISSEHTLFTSGESIGKAMDKVIADQNHASGFEQGLLFDDEVPLDGGVQSYKIGVPFTSSKSTFFKYSESKGLYYVEEYGKEFVDGATEKQVTVMNVVIIKTSVTPVPGDTEGRLNITLTGGGDGYFACGGKYIPIKWSRTAYDSTFSYTTNDGTPLVLGRGRSFVCVIPDNMKPSFLN